MHVWLLTGETGTGKSETLAALKTEYGASLAIFDPLSPKLRSWAEPDPSIIQLVAFDHMSSLERAAETIAAALKWCEDHHRTLLLIEQRREDFSELGISVPCDALEIRLSRVNGAEAVTLIQGRDKVSFTNRQIFELFGMFAPRRNVSQGASHAA